ncbi:DNA polymerase IV [Lactobacillus sp. DCY120]|uniref:DNA polymerase IV n=1 Tax=Bombilactobacillus apium TaxID=2675299 RepID=A0A850R570_9LACO|nr:DNA polymerase IV [Bombilactobacillus apium]NVY97111.1 DNA polymerase IV [Bombilactobacillus apium]
MSFLELPLVVHDDRQILHVDMDAFYASVEERDHPAYRQKALVVAPDPRQHNGHGVITTANYQARKYGVGSGMPAIKALEQIPAAKLLFKPPDFSLYRQVSEQVHEIFNQVTPIWEPVALDEAYLDVTQNNLGQADPVQLGLLIQRTVLRKLQLTCSIGVSYNMFLAKMASNYAKPFGLTVVPSNQASQFLAPLPVARLHGIGKKMQEQLADLNLKTVRDLQSLSLDFLVQHWGSVGYSLYQRIRGVDNRPVQAQRTRKSIGKERTFNRPVFAEGEIQKILQELADQVAEVLQNKHLHGKTVILKVRTVEFVTWTRRQTQTKFLQTAPAILAVVQEILQTLDLREQPLRLLGITVTNLQPQSFTEINLFEE